MAFRVTFKDLPSPFESFNGTTMWLDEPEEVCELGGVSDPASCGANPTFWASQLTCDPVYTNWTAIDVVHVYGEGIVPDGAIYEVQGINNHTSCSESNEAHYSRALTISTSKWGDLVGAFLSSVWLPPDGIVEIVTDVTAESNKFSNVPSAPIKARCDVEPETLDHKINISDIVQILDAFRGIPYPFDGPTACP